jgi:hypothetical protein
MRAEHCGCADLSHSDRQTHSNCLQHQLQHPAEVATGTGGVCWCLACSTT